MKKETAVEMIFESFFDMKWEDMQDWQKPVIFLQAKEMEMRQIMEAFNAGEHYDGSDGEIKYYRETFNID